MRLHDDVIPKSNPDTDAPPANFDARQFPVIARHHFGIEPPRPWKPLALALKVGST